jgi:co-chaperonin GroES (HSP10)
VHAALARLAAHARPLPAEELARIPALIAECPLKPVQDYIVVYQDALNLTPSGVVFIPTKALEESQKHWGHAGTVLAVGPGKWVQVGRRQVRTPMELRPGDRVRFGEFLYSRPLDDQRYVVMQEADVTVVEEPERLAA